MGNRGCLHDGEQRIVRRVRPGYRAWVTCRLAFKGRHREVMRPGRYTELFFLDEATALAAGHRPCGECRRDDFVRFKTAWLHGNRDRGLGPSPPISTLDRALDRDRLGGNGRARRTAAAVDSLPDGVFVADRRGRPLLLWRDALWPWTPAGYRRPRPRPAGGRITVLTPRSTVRAIRAGYVPAVHPGLEVRGGPPLSGRSPGRARRPPPSASALPAR